MISKASSVFLSALPADAGSLNLNQDSLQCSACGTVFNIVREIPRFVRNDDYAESFGFQWNVHARTQLDSFTKKSISRDRLFKATGWPSDLSGQTVLEAGSGAGRFTEVLVTTGASIISFDLSSAVDANHRSNGQHENFAYYPGQHPGHSGATAFHG